MHTSPPIDRMNTISIIKQNEALILTRKKVSRTRPNVVVTGSHNPPARTVADNYEMTDKIVIFTDLLYTRQGHRVGRQCLRVITVSRCSRVRVQWSVTVLGQAGGSEVLW